MQSKIIVTADNSKTLLIPELNETYHSTNGALTEAIHVFQNAGIDHADKDTLHIFEMGFGTGLNAILTYKKALNEGLTINYDCIEAYPVTLEQANQMDYLDQKLVGEVNAFQSMHQAENNTTCQLDKNFAFTKTIAKIQDHVLPQNTYDILFFDAFGPKVQEELWKIDILSKLYNSLKSGGFLVTYCAQGAFKRTLKEIGFLVECIPGPPGKREMTRAYKQ